MKRTQFIQSLLGLGAVSALPPLPRSWSKSTYDKFYIQQFFVAGFKYYAGPRIINGMKQGDLLEMRREPNNRYDRSAVALFWNEHKIGFLPAAGNDTISKLLDIAWPPLVAEITHIETKAQTWENIAAAVYLLKENSDSQPLTSQAQYLSVLETPNYYSLSRSDNKVDTFFRPGQSKTYTQNLNVPYEEPQPRTRLRTEPHPEAKRKKGPRTDWYNLLEKQSPNDHIYDIIHHNLDPHIELGKDGNFLIFDAEKLYKRFSFSRVNQLVSQNTKPLIGQFEKGRYHAITTDSIKSLLCYVKTMRNTNDNSGTEYIELIFGLKPWGK
jgi:hypothetical protein